MKKLLLSVIALFLAAASHGQIVLNSGDYPVPVFGTDSLKVTTVASLFPSMSAATDGSWDMSIVTDTIPVFFAYRVPTTTYQFADSDFFSLSSYVYQGNLQSSIVSDSLFEYGINIQKAAFSLPTGNPTDSLWIPEQTSTYSSPRVKIVFPTTYSSFWSSNYHFNLDFAISITTLSLDHNPGVIESYITKRDSVVGWGKMRVKDLLGTPSDRFNVLQIQTETKKVDSFFINGVPAPITLLIALGLMQGQITKTYEQNYYRASELTPFANVQFLDSTYSTPTKATTHTQRLVNVGVTKVIDSSSINIYPNPVHGDLVSLTLPAVVGIWSYELIDENGNLTATDAIRLTGNKAQLLLPRSILSGIYILKLCNNGKQISAKSIEIIK